MATDARLKKEKRASLRSCVSVAAAILPVRDGKEQDWVLITRLHMLPPPTFLRGLTSNTGVYCCVPWPWDETTESAIASRDGDEREMGRMRVLQSKEWMWFDEFHQPTHQPSTTNPSHIAHLTAASHCISLIVPPHLARLLRVGIPLHPYSVQRSAHSRP